MGISAYDLLKWACFSKLVMMTFALACTYMCGHYASEDVDSSRRQPPGGVNFTQVFRKPQEGHKGNKHILSAFIISQR